jgi:hypothetical protein
VKDLAVIRADDSVDMMMSWALIVKNPALVRVDSSSFLLRMTYLPLSILEMKITHSAEIHPGNDYRSGGHMP